MARSLRIRIFAMVFLVVAVAVAIVSILAGQGTLLALRGVAGLSAQRDWRMAAILLQQSTRRGDLPGVQQRAEELGLAMNAHLVIFDAEGTVLADSTGRQIGRVLPLPVSPPGTQLAPPLSIHDQPAFLALSYRSASIAAEDVMTYLTAPPSGSAMLSTGWLRTFPTQAILEPFYRLLLLAALAGGSVALLLTGLLSRRIVGPVEGLTAAVRRMERGDLAQRVPVETEDEIGELAHAFNAMAGSLSRSEDLRRQMVSDIAHELRTPLTNIQGYLEAIRDGVLEARPEVVESLYEESVLLNRLVNDLQDLALAEAGQLKLMRQPVILSQAVERTLAPLARQPATGPAVHLDLPPDLPPVLADTERLSQIVRNLLINARHHTPPEGAITISAQAVPEGVAVTVRDTGRGIAPQHLPYVFERFYRADPSRTRATGGAGLGLAIVKQLVEAHGGQVSIESEVGRGTAVTFTLPVAP